MTANNTTPSQDQESTARVTISPSVYIGGLGSFKVPNAEIEASRRADGIHTAGYNLLKNSGTPGCQISLRSYSWQYEDILSFFLSDTVYQL